MFVCPADQLMLPLPQMGVSSGLKPARRPLKIEKPRPLKLATNLNSSDLNLESVLAEMDEVSQLLQAGSWDHRTLYPAIASLCENLKMFGPQLENVFKDQLDQCYVWLRTGCRDDRLSLAARYRLLEIIELRAMNWKPNQNLISYYQTKLQHIEAEEAAMEEQTELAALMSSPHGALTTLTAIPSTPLQTPTTPSAPLYHGHQLGTSAGLQYASFPQPNLLQPAQPVLFTGQYQQTVLPLDQYQQQTQVLAPAPLLSPGEVVRNSGKFTKPTRIAGKNYCKDEVVIRNQDSGKVMGIKGRRVHMIEELSETIISFQRVAPGARERLVQITGPSEESISQAKQLIEDTIRRNASPVREALSMSSGGSCSAFSSSPLNGSNSSIASHTDEETGSMNSCRRGGGVLGGTVSEGGPGSDACMGDYRYTVAHNSQAVRITGNNLKMVRAAKLVLDEFFNGEKNLNNIAQLLSAEGEDTSLSSPNPNPLCPPSSPPMLVKPATPPATPPLSVTASPTATDAEEAPTRGDESPKLGGVGILRQPLFPSSSKEAVEVADSASSVAVKSRRAAFAKTSEDRASTGSSGDEASDGGGGGGELKRYNKHELIAIASSPASKLTPAGWASVVKSNPELIKKGSVYQAGVQATMTDHGEASINGAPTYLKPGDLLFATSSDERKSVEAGAPKGAKSSQ
ncbi:K domain type 1 [Trinorchestia longiramus]|nr:K domain type 1 [Trinorchestia longiramus]